MTSHQRRIIMYDHIGLKVKDVDAAVRFYTAALGGARACALLPR